MRLASIRVKCFEEDDAEEEDEDDAEVCWSSARENRFRVTVQSASKHVDARAAYPDVRVVDRDDDNNTATLVVVRRKLLLLLLLLLRRNKTLESCDF